MFLGFYIFCFSFCFFIIFCSSVSNDADKETVPEVAIGFLFSPSAAFSSLSFSFSSSSSSASDDDDNEEAGDKEADDEEANDEEEEVESRVDPGFLLTLSVLRGCSER